MPTIRHHQNEPTDPPIWCWHQHHTKMLVCHLCFREGGQFAWPKRVKGGKGDRTRKGWGEVIRSDNLDWGLYNKKFSVWESSWTKQRGYIENKGVFVQAEQGS